MVFEVTAGDEISFPSALNFHTTVRIDGVLDEVYTPRCSGPPRNIAVSGSEAPAMRRAVAETRERAVFIDRRVAKESDYVRYPGFSVDRKKLLAYYQTSVCL